MDRKKTLKPRKISPTPDPTRTALLELERGAFQKKWTGRLPIGLLYPNHYRVGMSSLGFQLVYRLLNEYDAIVCERIFMPDPGQPILSMETGRKPADFPLIFCSVSFEHDYLNIARFFRLAGIEPFAVDRHGEIRAGQPLVVCGGVAAFMNPEPLAPFMDLFAVGEAEPLLPGLISALESADLRDRNGLLYQLNRDIRGFYAPSLYRPRYDDQNRFERFDSSPGLPPRISRIGLAAAGRAGHSELLTGETEFADLYLTELGRGCSRGCRFCTAGFVYRPPRLWDADAILASLAERPDGVARVGLLGMEMTGHDTLDLIAGRLSSEGCALSFSSLRADRMSDRLLELLGESNLKSAAIAPDGASERLRRVINKQLTEADLIAAADKLTRAGLRRIKLYLMIGLPTETDVDLEEFVQLVARMQESMQRTGRKRGWLSNLSVSVNSFVPKPWTPFQYHPYGASQRLEPEAAISGAEAARSLKDKIKRLRKRFASVPNLQIKFDSPDQALFQAVLARGDRRLAPLLLNMTDSGISFRQALKGQGLSERLYATRQYDRGSGLPWSIIDHSISDGYLWNEYCRSFHEKSTPPCDTRVCRRCGVCNDQG